MSYWAKVLDGKVINMMVADESFFTSGTFVETIPGTWIECDYFTVGGIRYDDEQHTIISQDQSKALRANYPGVGYIYNEKEDVFHLPQPFPSWTISAPDWIWKSPIPYPNDGKDYIWDEPTKTWITTQI